MFAEIGFPLDVGDDVYDLVTAVASHAVKTLWARAAPRLLGEAGAEWRSDASFFEVPAEHEDEDEDADEPAHDAHAQMAARHPLTLELNAVLKGELAQHALSEAKKALTDAQRGADAPAAPAAAPAALVPHDGGGTRHPSRSLHLMYAPADVVAEVVEDVEARKQVSPAQAVYLAAVFEYLAAEVLELGGTAAKEVSCFF